MPCHFLIYVSPHGFMYYEPPAKEPRFLLNAYSFSYNLYFEDPNIPHMLLYRFTTIIAPWYCFTVLDRINVTGIYKSLYSRTACGAFTTRLVFTFITSPCVCKINTNIHTKLYNIFFTLEYQRRDYLNSISAVQCIHSIYRLKKLNRTIPKSSLAVNKSGAVINC